MLKGNADADTCSASCFFSKSANWCDIVDAAIKLVGNSDKHQNYLKNFLEQLKILEHTWNEAEKEHSTMCIENDKLMSKLLREKTKSAVLEKKIQVMHDGQKNIEHLKQMYVAMKNEGDKICASKLKEIGVQTELFKKEQGSGSDSELANTTAVSDSIISVKKSDLNKAQKNLGDLKEMLKKREETWTRSRRREDELRIEIGKLQQTCIELGNSTEDGDKHDGQMNPGDNVEKTEELLKIIVKMGTRLRELEMLGKIENCSTMFNEREKKIVQNINRIAKFTKHPTTRKTVSATVSKVPKTTIKTSTSLSTNDKRYTPESVSKESHYRELEMLQRKKRDVEKTAMELKKIVQETMSCKTK